MSTLTPPAADMPDFNAVISDLDGVVYRGDAPIPEAVGAVRRWHAAGVRYCFVTTNSTRSATDFAANLRRFGIEARAEQVVTSADATALLLRERWPSGARVFVIGAPALAETIGAAGFEIAAERAEIVVVGLDQQFTYAKLKQASRLVRAGAVLIGTNPDLMLPTEDGFDPGAGTLIGAVT